MNTGIFQKSAASINQVANFLGLNNWRLSTCKFEVPKNIDSIEDFKSDGYVGDPALTVSFLAFNNDFLKQYGINPDFQDITPVAGMLDRFFSRQANNRATNPDDYAGKTFFTTSTDGFSNNIIEYKIPNSSPLLRQWGTNSDTFRVIAILSGQGYTDKLDLLRNIASTDLGTVGGIFSHSLLGKFYNCFIKKLDVITTNQMYNATIVALDIVCPNKKASKIDKDKTFIQDAVADTVTGLQAVGALTQLPQVVQSIIDTNPALNATFNNADGSSGYIKNNNADGSITGVSNSQTNFSASYQNVQDLPERVHTIIEQAHQLAGTQTNNFGTGTLTTTTTSIHTSATAVPYSEEITHYGNTSSNNTVADTEDNTSINFINVTANTVNAKPKQKTTTTTRTIGGSDGDYKIRVTKQVEKIISKPSSREKLIYDANKIIEDLHDIYKLTNNGDIIVLIANIRKIITILVFRESYEIDRQTTLQKIDLLRATDIMLDNPELRYHRTLQRGMSIQYEQ